MKPKYLNITLLIMEYKEPKKRVTKSDKKDKKGVYTSKHIRNLLKQKEAAIDKRNNGPIPTTPGALLPNGRV